MIMLPLFNVLLLGVGVMKKILVAALILCIAVTFFGCEDRSNEDGSNPALNNDSSYDPFEEVVSDDLYAYPQYTETWEYNDIAQLTYNGEDISVTIHIDNEKHKFELGFMAFVDGYCVPVTIGGQTDTMGVVSFAEKESKDVVISFSPTVGKKGRCFRRGSMGKGAFCSSQQWNKRRGYLFT